MERQVSKLFYVAQILEELDIFSMREKQLCVV
jgi:hypothetical protein